LREKLSDWEGEGGVTKTDVKRWKKEIEGIDKVHRERILTLTVAAECGWKVAGDMCFIKKRTKPNKIRKKSLPQIMRI